MGRDKPLSARQPRLPALQHTPRLAPLQNEPSLLGKVPSQQSSVAGAATGGYTVLPAALNAALDDPLSLMALEDWQRTHRERAGQHVDYDSQLLSCEARLRKLDHLTTRLRPPNMVVTAVVFDLLRRVFLTLPPALSGLCGQLLRFIEGAVYSDELASSADQQHLQDVLGSPVDKLPYFIVVRRQQDVLARLEAKTDALQQHVDDHMERRRNVLDFITRLQQEERLELQQWLFRFWVMTFQHRKFRIIKMASVVLSASQDVVTPFVSWRLYVCQQRLEKAQEECETKDKQASKVANRITEVEIENEEQQKKLQSSLDASANLKARCLEEQQEHARLQRLWDATQPELLLTVFAQSLEFLFSLVMRAARFSGLALRQRLAGKDIAPLLYGLPQLKNLTTEAFLIHWVNCCLVKARAAADQLLNLPGIPHGSRAQLELVVHQPDIHNLDEDLSDGGALCALLAILQAEAEGRSFSVGDLWPLAERDFDLRAERLWSVLRPFAPTARARCLLSPVDIVVGNSGPLGMFLACMFLQEPLLPDLDEGTSPADKAAKREQLERVLCKVEEHAGSAASEPPEDPTPLLHGGEDFQALAQTSTEQLLLRWVNVQLQSVFHRPVENFGSDLQDGEAIGLLLSVIAPEVITEEYSEDPEERLDQIVGAAARCTDFELLTATAILEGQSDMLAAFFAQLFLTRPNLAAKPDSLLAMHLRLLEGLCADGLATMANAGDDAQVMKMCVTLDARWSEFMLAAHTVQEASKTMQGVNDRMRTFLGDTLAHRAQGKPRTMLDAKEAREFLFYTSLNLEHVQSMMQKETVDQTVLTRVEELLRKHFRLLRDVYRHYTSIGGGITLEGLMKIYQDCKLRTRDLAPHHLEVIFCDHMDMTSAERVLSPNQFVEVLLQCANLKFKEKMANLPDQLSYLIEHHIKPHACREDSQNIFQRMAYDPKVRKVLDHHSKELKIIFLLYAMMDTSTTDAMQRVHTMNLKEFHMLLTHTDMLDETLTEAAMQQIFEGIQTSATDEDGGADVVGEEAGIDDDEELSFSEFLDGLVAIAAYKYPDPFTPFETRVNNFVLNLFGLVRRHWSRKRISPQVDAMLNALQKKLR